MFIQQIGLNVLVNKSVLGYHELKKVLKNICIAVSLASSSVYTMAPNLKKITPKNNSKQSMSAGNYFEKV